MRTDSEDIIKLKAFLLKTSVSLANSTAKFAFLSICLSLGIIPFGFKLKFSLQSGLPTNAADGYNDRVKEILDGTSLNLLITAKEGEAMKISYLNQQLLETFNKLEDKELFSNLAVAKFKKILLLRIKIHQNKLKKLLNNTSPPLFIDVDEEISNFEAKLFSGDVLTSPIADFDWFDESSFPPLPSHSRRDWTEDLETFRPPALLAQSLATSSLNLPAEVLENSLTSAPLAPTSGTSSAAQFALTPATSSSVSFALPLTNTNNQASRRVSVATSPIEMVHYSANNFKPLVLHDITVSDGIISLLKKGPTFSPTPLNPPDLFSVEENILDWKERIRWAYKFRLDMLRDNPQSELPATNFVKPPWY